MSPPSKIHATTYANQRGCELRTHPRPGTHKRRAYPAVTLENGLVSMEATPDHLVKVVQLNATASPLLQLPSEIRHEIFRYAMGGYTVALSSDCKLPSPKERDDKNIIMNSPKNPLHNRKPSNQTPAFQLPQVCRQIYAETATLGYRLNTFILPQSLEYDSGLLPQSWLSQRNPAQLSAITSIEPSGWDASIYHQDTCINSFSRHLPSLQRIYADRLVCQLAGSVESEEGSNEYSTEAYCDQMVRKVRENEEKDVEVVFRNEMEGPLYKVETRRGVIFYNW